MSSSELSTTEILVILSVIACCIYFYFNKSSVSKYKRPIYKNDNYHDDTAFQFTNKSFITLDHQEIKTNNKHLKKVYTYIFFLFI